MIDRKTNKTPWFEKTKKQLFPKIFQNLVDFLIPNKDKGSFSKIKI